MRAAGVRQEEIIELTGKELKLRVDLFRVGIEKSTPHTRYAVDAVDRAENDTSHRSPERYIDV